jgi:hypothetical protein
MFIFSLDPVGLTNTIPLHNLTSYPLSSRVETEMRFLVNPKTYSTSTNQNGLPESLLNETVPTPCALYHLSSPSSITRFKPPSYSLVNNSLQPIIWKNALLSTNHMYESVVLDVQVMKQKYSSKLLENSSTAAEAAIYGWFFFFFSGHYEAKCPIL